MYTNRQITTLSVLLLVLIGIGFASSKYAEKNPVTSTENGTQAAVKPVSYTGQDGKTALELLEAKHRVEVTEYSSFGKLVTSIDGVDSTGNSFWLLYVDGRQATDAADKVITKNGENLEWHYETFDF